MCHPEGRSPEGSLGLSQDDNYDVILKGEALKDL